MKRFFYGASIALLLIVSLLAITAFSVAYFYHPNQFKLGPVSYYLGDQKYEIPTKFNPINGSTKPGGTRIVIHVSYPSLKGQYEDPEYTKHALTVSKSTASDPAYGLLDEQCGEMSFCGVGDAGNTSFKRDGFTYGLHYQGGVITFANKEEVRKFEDSIVSLFDSFK